MASTTFITNAGALATKKRILAGKTEERFRQASQMQAQKMKFVAVSLSSGPLAQKQLAKLGNPYAVRFPSGQAGQPDFVINIQSGRFQGSWRTRVQKTARGWTVSLWNDAPEAKRLLGTSKMRARMILDEVVRRTSPVLPAQIRKVCRLAVQQNSISLPPGGALLYAFVVGASSAASGLESAF